MILVLLIVILLGGGIAAAVVAGRNPEHARYVSLGSVLLALAMGLGLWPGGDVLNADGAWLVGYRAAWIPQLGISLHLAMDGMSLLLVLLTLFLGVVCVLVSWREITEKVGFYHLNLLWTLAGVVGVFLAVDLFLFFVFWEVMLVPMYFLISIWGHEQREYAALKFFIFTQASSLLMLIAIVALALVHRDLHGYVTFNYFDLLEMDIPGSTGYWLMLGFFVAFAVKLPTVPAHTWLPDAHTQAPTAGSVILAGVLLKTGGYGLLRFVVPLFPEPALDFAPVAFALGVAGILYGAVLAFAQSDFKRLVAYSSVSHMGFVLLGVFAWNAAAVNGAILQMLAHGVSTSALFMIAGLLQYRLHTRDMGEMGGLWSRAPRLAALAMFFAVASLGLPGLGNFVGEFLILLGTFRVDVLTTVLAAIGLVGASIYSLYLVQRAFHGPDDDAPRIEDLDRREMTSLAMLTVAIVWLGLYPQPVIDVAMPSIRFLESIVAFRVEAGLP